MFGLKNCVRSKQRCPSLLLGSTSNVLFQLNITAQISFFTLQYLCIVICVLIWTIELFINIVGKNQIWLLEKSVMVCIKYNANEFKKTVLKYLRLILRWTSNECVYIKCLFWGDGVGGFQTTIRYPTYKLNNFPFLPISTAFRQLIRLLYKPIHSTWNV